MTKAHTEDVIGMTALAVTLILALLLARLVAGAMIGIGSLMVG